MTKAKTSKLKASDPVAWGATISKRGKNEAKILYRCRRGSFVMSANALAQAPGQPTALPRMPGNYRAPKQLGKRQGLAAFRHPFACTQVLTGYTFR